MGKKVSGGNRRDINSGAADGRVAVSGIIP